MARDTLDQASIEHAECVCVCVCVCLLWFEKKKKRRDMLYQKLIIILIE